MPPNNTYRLAFQLDLSQPSRELDRFAQRVNALLGRVQAAGQTAAGTQSLARGLPVRLPPGTSQADQAAAVLGYARGEAYGQVRARQDLPRGDPGRVSARQATQLRRQIDAFFQNEIEAVARQYGIDPASVRQSAKPYHTQGFDNARQVAQQDLAASQKQQADAAKQAAVQQRQQNQATRQAAAAAQAQAKATSANAATTAAQTRAAAQATAAQAASTRAQAQAANAEARLLNANNRLAAARARAAAQAGAGGAGGGGAAAPGAPTSLAQRLQARFGGGGFGVGSHRNAADYPTGPQLFGQALLTNIRYGVTGGLLYGAVSGISEMIREAEELERILNQIEQQFESIGQPGQFDTFKTAILDIARATGQAADEVAFVAFQLKGAFGEDTARVINEVNSAIGLTRVTGLELAEVVDSFTALTQSFGEGSLSIEEIGDKALGLQERFGVLASETVKFAADLAPMAAQIGFTADEVEALGASFQKYSGRSGAAGAEAFGRIFSQVQENAAEFVSFYRQIFGGLADGQERVNTIASSFARGDISTFFKQLLADYQSLSESQQNYVLDLLGGRRETQSLVGVLENGSELLREFGRAGEDAGKQQEYLADLQETLAQRIARLSEQFRQLGTTLLESGLGDVLKDMVTVGSILITTLRSVLSIVDGLNDATGGWLLKVASVYATFRLLASLSGLRGRGGLLGLLGAGAAVPGSFAGRVATAYRGAPPGAQAIAGYAAGGIFGTAGAGAGAATTVAAGGFRSAALAAISSPAFIAAAALVGTTVVQHFADKASEAARKRVASIAAAGGDEGAFDTPREQERLEHLARRGDGDAGERVKGIFGLSEYEKTTKEARERFLELEGSQVGKELNALVEEGYIEAYTTTKEYQDTLDAFNKAFPERKKKTPKSAQREIAKLARDLQSGEADLDDFDLAVSLMSALKNDPTAKGIINRINGVADQLRQASLGAAVANVQQTFQTVEEARAAFQAGDAGLGQYISALEFHRESLQSLVRQGGGSADDTKKLAGIQKEINTAYSEALQQQTESAIAFAEISGRATPEFRTNQLRALLRNPKLQDPAVRREVTEQLLQSMRDTLDLKASMAESAAEELRILREGIPIDKDIQVELVAEELRATDVTFQLFLATIKNPDLLESMDDIIDEIAELLVKTDLLVQEATTVVLNKKRDEIERLIDVFLEHAGEGGIRSDAFQKLQAALFAIDAAIAAVQETVPADYAGPQAPTAVRGTPEQQAAADERAKSDLEQQMREAQRAFQELWDAQAEYAAALVENDPVAAAQEAQRQADVAMSRAQNDAERIRAQAARIRADRQFAEAIHDVQTSRLELAQAIAEAAGDEVKAAEIGTRLAKAEVEYLKSIGAGEAAINRAEANVVRQEAAESEAKFRDRIDDQEFLHEMGRVTTKQLITFYEGLLATVGDNEDRRREIERRIKQLKDEIGQDYQFNLPDVVLPTVYEARRATGRGGFDRYGPGSVMNDNRQINITLNANNSVDGKKAVEYMVDALNAPPRYGTRPRFLGIV